MKIILIVWSLWLASGVPAGRLGNGSGVSVPRRAGDMERGSAPASAPSSGTTSSPASTSSAGSTCSDVSAEGNQTADPARKPTIVGAVVDQAGQPLPNVGVSLRMVGAAAGPSRTESTDDEGKFQFSGLSSRVFIMSARVPTHYMDSPNDEPTYVRAGESIKIRMLKGGILTGKVTGPSGEALIAAPVRPTRVRDQEGNPAKGALALREFQTDDRGVYRIYGLPPGSYVVSVGGGRSYGLQKPYDLNGPTYFPSSTRDTASEVVVTAGQETSGIDIRYRDDPGYRVSGTVSGIPGSSSVFAGGTGVALTNVKSGFVESNTYISPSDPNKAFIFYGVPDGEYDVTAQRVGGREDGLASSPLRITVKGSDVTGLALTLAPLGKISGQIIMDPMPEVRKKEETQAADPPLAETLVAVRREGKQNPNLPSSAAAAVDEKGMFVLGNLSAGNYRFEIGLPSEDWYLREMALAKPGRPAEGKRGRAAAASTALDIAARGLAVKQGEHIEGISIGFGRGAAYVAGTVTPAADGATLPARIRLCLVPVEAERASDVLAYRQTVVRGDGKFAIANVAPGKYRAIAVPALADEAPEARDSEIAWDPAARKQLRGRADSDGVELELAPKKRINDFVLKYRPAAGGAHTRF